MALARVAARAAVGFNGLRAAMVPDVSRWPALPGADGRFGWRAFFRPIDDHMASFSRCPRSVVSILLSSSLAHRAHPGLRSYAVLIIIVAAAAAVAAGAAAAAAQWQSSRLCGFGSACICPFHHMRSASIPRHRVPHPPDWPPPRPTPFFLLASPAAVSCTMMPGCSQVPCYARLPSTVFCVSTTVLVSRCPCVHVSMCQPAWFTSATRHHVGLDRACCSDRPQAILLSAHQPCKTAKRSHTENCCPQISCQMHPHFLIPFSCPSNRSLHMRTV